MTHGEICCKKNIIKGTAESMALTVNTQNKVTTPAFTYDAAGNVTSDTTVAMTYDAEGRMTPTSGTTYTYDGDGRKSPEIRWNSLLGG
jgi:hypothetical protein